MKDKTQLHNIQHLYIIYIHIYDTSSLYFFYLNLNRMVYLNLSVCIHTGSLTTAGRRHVLDMQSINAF